MFLASRPVLAAAVIASLSLSACGKKQDLYSPPPPPAPTATPPTGPQAPGSQSQAGLGGGLNPNGQNGPSSPRAGKKHDGRNDRSDEDPEDGNGLPPPRGSRDNSEPQGTGVLPGGDDAPRAEVVSNESHRRSESSSSVHALIGFLKERNSRVDEVSRDNNIKAAESVTSARLTLNGSQSASLTVSFNLGGRLSTVELTSNVGAGPAAQLTNLTGDQGGVSVSGTLKCLDLNGECEISFARLRVATSEGVAIVNIVFQNSESDLHFQLPKNPTQEPGFNAIREVMRNTTMNKGGNKFVLSEMATYTVVNGNSGLALKLRTNNQQALSYGAITESRRSSGLLLPVEISDFSKSIAEARVIADNGAGEVQVRYKTIGSRGFDSNEFVIKYTRQNKAIVEINDDNLR